MEAQQWLDNFDNRKEAAQILAGTKVFWSYLPQRFLLTHFKVNMTWVMVAKLMINQWLLITGKMKKAVFLILTKVMIYGS